MTWFKDKTIKCSCCGTQVQKTKDICKDCFDEHFLDKLSPFERAKKGMDAEDKIVLKQLLKEETLPPDLSCYKVLTPKSKRRKLNKTGGQK